MLAQNDPGYASKNRATGNEIMLASLWEKVRARGVAGTAKAVFGRIARASNKIATLVFSPFDPHFYLQRVTGVVHVGAHVGQERELYAQHKLNVLWVEPQPDIYAQLCRNIEPFADQKAVNKLLADKDGAEYTLHVSSNRGASSSILDLAKHKDIWPDVHYVSQLAIKSMTLETLLDSLGEASTAYQALVMDTQGSELLVLKGAGKFLGQFKFIKTEAADFESYKNCAMIDELTSYLGQFGFKLIHKDKFAESDKGGHYFDVLYQKA